MNEGSVRTLKTQNERKLQKKEEINEKERGEGHENVP